MSDTTPQNTSSNKGRAENYGKIKDQIEAMLRQGCSTKEIVETLHCSNGTVGYHIKRLQLHDIKQNKARKEYDISAIQMYHNDGYSAIDCAKKFGFSLDSWWYWIRVGKIVPTHPRQKSLEALLVVDSKAIPSTIKNRLVTEGLLEYICHLCGIGDEWNGNPLVLQLDHINGNPKDNRIENLRFLCPNCHSQTETFGGRSRKKPSIQELPGHLECSTCHEVKSVDDFYRRSDLGNEKQISCKSCIKAMVYERRKRIRASHSS